jgi:hypothetical protein
VYWTNFRSDRMLSIYGKGDVESIPGPMLKKIKEAMEND